MIDDLIHYRDEITSLWNSVEDLIPTLKKRSYLRDSLEKAAFHLEDALAIVEDDLKQAGEESL